MNLIFTATLLLIVLINTSFISIKCDVSCNKTVFSIYNKLDSLKLLDNYGDKDTLYIFLNQQHKKGDIIFIYNNTVLSKRNIQFDKSEINGRLWLYYDKCPSPSNVDFKLINGNITTGAILFSKDSIIDVKYTIRSH